MKEHKNKLGQSIGVPLPDWQPKAPPPKTPMWGRYCRLEHLDPKLHAPALFEAYSHDTENRGWTYLPYGPFEEFEEFADWMNTACTGEDPLFHAIIDLKTDHAVGIASYLRIDPPVGVIEVGHIHFSPLMKQTPIATESMFLMMQRAFDELGYRRYEWKCDNANGPSKKAASRLGFEFEGVFRQATIYKNRNRDTAWFSVIDKEWPALKQVFENWLDPYNFDEKGKQKSSLSELTSKASEG